MLRWLSGFFAASLCALVSAESAFSLLSCLHLGVSFLSALSVVLISDVDIGIITSLCDLVGLSNSAISSEIESSSETSEFS